MVALWECTGCQVRYRIGFFRCPRCEATTFRRVEIMPKISAGAGATNAAADTVETHDEVVVSERLATGDLVDSEPAVDEDDDPDYEHWTNPDLQDALARRHLPTSGNKADMAARLRADDAAALELTGEQGPELVELGSGSAVEGPAEGDAG